MTILSRIEDCLEYLAAFALKNQPQRTSTNDLDDFTVLAKMADELRKIER